MRLNFTPSRIAAECIRHRVQLDLPRILDVERSGRKILGESDRGERVEEVVDHLVVDLDLNSREEEAGRKFTCQRREWTKCAVIAA